MSSLHNVKKSISANESFSDLSGQKIPDNIYYEEAWDLRMARLGVDIDELNNIFSDSSSPDNNNLEGNTMTRSCMEPLERHEPQIISMSSSAIASSFIANNPVYSFKSYESNPSSVAVSPPRMLTQADPMKQYLIDSDLTPSDRNGSMATSCPKSICGLILNNDCYELPTSQLANAITDNERGLFSNATISAFKPLAISKSRASHSTALFNNECYTGVPGPLLNNGPPNSNYGYSRQISAPVDSATDMLRKMTYSDDLKSASKTLQFRMPRRSIKSMHDSSNTAVASQSTIFKNRSQVDQHLHESSHISSRLLYKSTVADESKLSDNYIKHLTGQEIAGNFIKHSQRPECHIQRTEDRYHMGYNDSRLDMIADSNRQLEEHLWYHPFLSRVAAEQLLAKYPEGSFLVRRSESSSNEYSLSIRYKLKWLHMKISRDIDGQFVLGQYSQPYPSIPIMIRHYSCSFLPVKGANLISLQQPVFRH